MGFWTSVKRMAMGEPVFQPADPVATNSSASVSPSPSVAGPDSLSPDQPAPQAPTTMQNGQKVIPEIEIESVECHENGDTVEVWATLQNNGQLPVFVDKIVIMGQKTELDFDLGAGGGARQVRLYRGETPHTNAYTYAELDYRLVDTGDYFRARYTQEYNFETDNNAYLPKALKLQRPVRDI